MRSPGVNLAEGLFFAITFAAIFASLAFATPIEIDKVGTRLTEIALTVSRLTHDLHTAADSLRAWRTLQPELF